MRNFQNVLFAALRRIKSAIIKTVACLHGETSQVS